MEIARELAARKRGEGHEEGGEDHQSVASVLPTPADLFEPGGLA